MYCYTTFFTFSLLFPFLYIYIYRNCCGGGRVWWWNWSIVLSLIIVLKCLKCFCKVVSNGELWFRMLWSNLYRSVFIDHDASRFKLECILHFLNIYHVLLHSCSICQFYAILCISNVRCASSKCVYNLLQYGVKILVITSFKDTEYIEILPDVERSTRGIFDNFFELFQYLNVYKHYSF